MHSSTHDLLPPDMHLQQSSGDCCAMTDQPLVCAPSCQRDSTSSPDKQKRLRMTLQLQTAKRPSIVDVDASKSSSAETNAKSHTRSSQQVRRRKPRPKRKSTYHVRKVRPGSSLTAASALCQHIDCGRFLTPASL